VFIVQTERIFTIMRKESFVSNATREMLLVSDSTRRNQRVPAKLSTIEPEAYTALIALMKYWSWPFRTKVTFHSDHKLWIYVIESASKSEKLMWRLLRLQMLRVSIELDVPR